jgi:MFS family permease
MVLLAGVGGGLEYYDFVVYAIFAPYISRAFFPADDPLTSLLLTFAVFAIGFVARPLGGVILSTIGDRYGRKNVFVGSLFTMSACTAAIGLLPDHATWGITATMLLIALRFVQGMCLGGELPGAVTYVVEVMPERRALACGVVYAFVNGGVVLAAAVNWTLQSTLPPAEAADTGWRIAFVFGGLLGFVSFWLRRSLEETPEFARMLAMKSVARRPLAELFRDFRAPMLVGIGVVSSTSAVNGLLFAHMTPYLVNVLRRDPMQVAVAMNAMLVAMSTVLVLAGALGDRWPKHRILRAGALVVVLGALPWYAAVASREEWLLPLMILAGAAVGIANGTFASTLADLYPARVRFSGVAMSMNLSVMIVSGTAPLLATWLIRQLGDPTAPAWIATAGAALCFVGTFFVARHAAAARAEPLEPAAPGASIPVARRAEAD